MDEIKLVIQNENTVIDILKQAHGHHAQSTKLPRKSLKPSSQRQRQAAAVSNRRARSADCAVVVKGLRYSLPECLWTVTHIKTQYVGDSLCRALAQMWRLQKGQQPLMEAEAYWRREVAAGRVLLSRRRQHQTDVVPPWEQVCDADNRVIQVGDKVKVLSHRHERVITASCPTLLATSPPLSTKGGGQYFVFDKPAGVSCCEDPDTVNTLRALASEQVGQRLHIAHRLDHCVTGCIILASSAKAASRARRLMQASKSNLKTTSTATTKVDAGAEAAAGAGETATETGAGKHYIARVRGQLPVALIASPEIAPWRGLLLSSIAQLQSETETETQTQPHVSCNSHSDAVDELWVELDNRPEMKVFLMCYVCHYTCLSAPANINLIPSRVCLIVDSLFMVYMYSHSVHCSVLFSGATVHCSSQIDSPLYYDTFANRSRVAGAGGSDSDSGSGSVLTSGVHTSDTANDTGAGGGGGGGKAGTPSTTVVTHLASLGDGTHLVRCQPVTGHR